MWLAWLELRTEEYVRNTQKNGWAADATRDFAPLLAETELPDGESDVRRNAKSRET
jgi:hypothetical protein